MSQEQVETNDVGAPASAFTGPEGTNDPGVRAAWVEFFSTLPSPARVLNVGAGNGAVALIAAETASARGCDWEIHATDPAQVNPARQVPALARRLEGITFHPGVAAERLPFEAESFDALCGHYLLEDTSADLAFGEMHRVMKSGSDAQFILHHADSELLRNARWAQQDAELVLKETKLYRRLHRLVTMEQVTPGATQRATDELRAAIQSVKTALAHAIETRGAGAGQILGVALDAVQKLLEMRKQLPPQTTGLEVERAEENLRASMRRVNELVAHARTEQDMAVLGKDAADAGFSQIEYTPQFHVGDKLIGWQFLLHRA